MTESPKKPSVLFVCSKNGGKSQLAAGLMRELAGDAVEVHSAGTTPGSCLNAESVESLAELGIDISAERPKAVAEDVLEAADVVVVLGTEARLEQRGTSGFGSTARFETWETEEPSKHGIEGMERMRLLRDDIKARVEALYADLTPEP
jgi:arsenate-mycothiol transferase